MKVLILILKDHGLFKISDIFVPFLLNQCRKLAPVTLCIKEQKSLTNHVVGKKKKLEAKQKLLQLQENIMKSLFSTPAFSCLALI